MRIVISGAGGLIGHSLFSLLSAQHHEVRRLVRRSPEPGSPDILWNPPLHGPDPGTLEGTEVFVHLSGESIASGRWTTTKKKAILESRIQSTQLLVQTLQRMKTPPAVFVGASAVGVYGNRGSEWLDERSTAGNGFLAEVCRQWEAASSSLEKIGVRLIQLRTGMVLSRQGGALASMLRPFRLGLGGRLGSGENYMSWIALDDLVRSIVFVIETPAISGAVNGVSPVPITNSDFTRTLGRVLNRPTIFAVPASVLRLILGEMADELLLASQRVRPSRLMDRGFSFRYIDVESALRGCLAD